jgi:hypothetical protein
MRDAAAHAPVTEVRPEAALLLCCTRTCLEAAHRVRLCTLLQHDLDWPWLLRSALQHGVMPLLSRHLGAACPGTVPHPVLAQLKAFFHANALHARWLATELCALVRLLEAHAIPAIPYKGPVLAATVYGDIALRQSGDLDLVVPKRDLLRAKAVLIARGYQPGLEMTKAPDSVHLHSRYFYSMVHRAKGGVVDLHWTFTQPYWSFVPDLERLWREREHVPLGDTRVPSFRPEDGLLLCVHGAKHFWSRLGWICDVAELLRVYPALDWGRLLVAARRLGALRMVLLGLCLPQSLLGMALPAEVVRHLDGDAVVQALAAQVRGWLFRAADEPPSTVSKNLCYLRMRERWQDRVPYIGYFLPLYLRQIVTPNAHDRALLPLPHACSALA